MLQIVGLAASILLFSLSLTAFPILPPFQYLDHIHITNTMDSPNALMMTYILRCMPRARHHSLVCSAASQGYHALKEMLLSGVPGNTLLIESVDLKDLLGEPNDNVDLRDVVGTIPLRVLI